MDNDAEPLPDQLLRWTFARALGIIYSIAFASFAVQAQGLLGSAGILPIREFLDDVYARNGATSYLLVPSLFWLSASDLALQLLPIVGVLIALLAALRFSHPLLFLALFVLYLSIVSVGQDFMSFQWDALLLEAGFLAIFLHTPTRAIIWLYRWLIFRLMFLSGIFKWLSGDPTWHNLTALTFHYETQPLPTVIGWFAFQLPTAFHQVST
ncbi:MAG: lipase maturation factor family protein, partial [Chloroflexi bacterium]|nr:lipase maturation factor family protein [Chloroflexota bacterium]